MFASILLPAVLSMVSGPAHAQSWDDFAGAFPMFPCDDGWTACLVDTARIEPALDNNPADMRVAWFALSPTSVFSPFSTLSAYTDFEPKNDGVAVVRKVPVVREVPSVAEVAEVPDVADVAEVRDVPEDLVALTGCDSPHLLESAALMGRLEPEQVACLEGRAVSAPKQTDREKASLVLLANAWASGDRGLWEDRVRRHLDHIDQSDPDLCYRYASYLSGLGASRASGVLRWSEVALENRMVWTGDTYTSRVTSLYRLRTKASQDLWSQSELEHAEAPDAETRGRVDRYRDLTKVNAREWVEYARAAGKDPTVALAVCRSAAGTADYCGE